MKRKDFNEYIDRGAFQELFITEMGWNNPDNSQPVYITIDEQDLDFTPVADKQGFHVYSCEIDVLPTAAECKKIDNKLRNYGYDYICIFVQTGTAHHLWLTPVKTNEKRELVKTEYISGAKADFLFSKVDDLTFGLTERVLITDVKNRVHGSFHLNSEKVTKDFYTQFRKEHKAFATHITGISNDRDRDWYTSVMLNRLMFCYFIQKKGFLDLNMNYLQEKLKWVKRMQGEDQFFGTFYKGFLCAMFHEGLNNPRHDSAEFEDMYGRIPYLNGGMFDDHQLERENEGIDIADVAFENLFNFFDKWNWHLDTRLTASGKDINPDVLGYIFEQYINDRAAMGAYYTKEDITEYIGKNCIIPFLMDKTAEKSADAFKPQGEVLSLLRQSGDKYIYDAVKKGYSSDWQQKLPDYINQGIDTTTPNLLERRSRWNEKTFEEFALPTEIWRETVERLQRCDRLLDIIRNYPHSPFGGTEGGSINDFITYNLDIRQFTEDVLRKTADHKLVAHFYRVLQNVTILDPTCGSGAFLFAALNILEPLYEACLDRMEEFHQQNGNLFTRELDEINAKYSSNRQYFIYKSIILRNLYGVDIMVEATEIAKLRLFLKMVAVVEVDKRKDNLGLDPLPDIDFNIKCGNTLVGYATEKELDDALAYGDMFANAEFKEDIEKKMKLVATAYGCFRSEQLKTYDDNASIKATKEQLKARLVELNNLLNRHMHQAITAGGNYEKWLESHQPFHWLAEFYQIIKGNGGFDVIIGNPPYVVYNAKKSVYKIDNYKTLPSANLYSFVFERSIKIGKSSIGLIIQMSSIATDSMSSLQKLLMDELSLVHYSIFPERPKQLFDGACIALSILICNKSSIVKGLFGSGVSRFFDTQREVVFRCLDYIPIEENDFLNNYTFFPKFGEKIEKHIFEKINIDGVLSKYFVKSSNNLFSYRTAGGRYWKPFINRRFATETSTNKTQHLEKNIDNKEIVAVLNSGLFWWYYVNYFDLFHLTSYMFSNFRYTSDSSYVSRQLIDLGAKLMYAFELNKSETVQFIKSQNRETVAESFSPQLSKPIIDEIDKVLAKHYGFTEEELDFIINYDIKYRMGDELNSDE